MTNWAFLTNHALVLTYIARHPRITALELANAIGITERTTRKIIADLLEAGYIARRREGRGNRYRIDPQLPIVHPSHWETVVGDLLQALGWKGRNRF